MYVVHWPGQTMFGPFTSISEAVVWSLAKFGPNWEKIIKIHSVEAPR